MAGTLTSYNSHLDFFYGKLETLNTDIAKKENHSVDSAVHGADIVAQPRSTALFNSETHPLETTPDEAAECQRVGINRAFGILLILAMVPFASMAPLDGGHNYAALKLLRFMAEMSIAPAFLFLSGLQCNRAVSGSWRDFLSKPAIIVFVFFIIGGVAAFLPVILHKSAFSDCFRQAWPFFRFLTLPFAYLCMMRLLIWMPPLILLMFALFLQMIAVRYATPTQEIWRYFPYFVAGVISIGHSEKLARWVRAYPVVPLICGMGVIAFTLLLAWRAPINTIDSALFSLGPITLALGLAAGLAAWGSGLALAGDPPDALLQFLGRFALAYAVAWGPVFFSAAAIARSIGAANPVILIILSIMSFVLITNCLKYWAEENWSDLIAWQEKSA